jgi:hypothetical protein
MLPAKNIDRIIVRIRFSCAEVVERAELCLEHGDWQPLLACCFVDTTVLVAEIDNIKSGK